MRTEIKGYGQGGTTHWRRYTWNPGEPWNPVDSNFQPDAALADYLASGVPFRPAELDETTREALRALGYLED